MVLLLDQIARNCYRGSEAALVYNYFDPLARAIAMRAIDQGDVIGSPEIRFHLARRMWFGLPLMHSEDLAIHQAALQYFELMSQEVEYLMDNGRGLDQIGEGDMKARAVFTREPDTTRKFLANMVGFENRHRAIIQQFGRYPHRNASLGRVPTAAETEYLENGGEVFG